LCKGGCRGGLKRGKLSFKSTKYLDYIDWREVRLKVMNKEDLDLKGFTQIKTIKQNFNKNRVNYNWSHLESLTLEN
jgi:hypothetical protein